MHGLVQLIVIICLVLGLFVQSAQAETNTLLGQEPLKQYSSSELSQWQYVLKAHPFQTANYHSKKTESWENLIKSAAGEPPLRQMLKVNQWFEQFTYKLDRTVYKKDDYWATPIEFIELGGDCEDYAIAKYMTLRRLGFPANTMKIAMVYDTSTYSDHAFLVVNYNDAEYILDNREKLVVSGFMKNRYKPHFAFNEYHVWTYDSPLINQTLRQYGSSQ
jgi:predicted transglutaminase-like cysteine proteinase